MTYLKQYDDYGFFGGTGIPFNVHFSFKKLFEYWESLAAGDDPAQAAWAQDVLKKLAHAPELRESFQDITRISRYERELRLLFSPLFPAPLTLNEIKAVGMPFMPLFFNMTQRLTRILDGASVEGMIKGRLFDHDEMYIAACVFILNAQFGANINFNRTIYFDLPGQNGIMRHYRTFINADFSEFKPNERFPGITEADIRLLIDNFDKPAIWKEKIPPHSFDFEGFALISLFDITQAEALSALKIDLLAKDALQSAGVIERIQGHLRSMFNIPDLRLGFAVFDEDRKVLKSLNNGFPSSFALAEPNPKKSDQSFCGFSHHTVFDLKKPAVIPHVTSQPAADNPLMLRVDSHGLESYLAAPLIFDEKIVGVLEMGSGVPNALNSAVASQLDLVNPLFTTALKRSVDELETQLEAIVQEKFTAIHPSVSWRFFDAAERLYNARKELKVPEIEEIVFHEVYPLYGQSDLKNSSVMRNAATQADLIEQMGYARDVLELASQFTQLPIYQSLIHRMKKHVAQIRRGLGAGDEISVLEFLKTEIYPVFGQIESLNETLGSAVAAYREKLDPGQGVVYNKRRDFEESVVRINERIDRQIEKAQVAAQAMFPHYFEKYKTDGVEHNLYIGQSLVNKQTFHPVYLQNLRLWQLATICEVENAVYQLRPELKVPLDICSLILVHGNPLSIKFRMDEKQFDVEGAYNIRYEIIKKRIDKAYIKGTEERLTQPGKIAIVYSQEKEAREYVHYLEYLAAEKRIKDKNEWLDLEDLQGVIGLKALRVEVLPERSDTVESKTAQASRLAQ